MFTNKRVSAKKRLKESKILFSKSVLDFNFHRSQGLGSSFSQKKSNSLYPSVQKKFCCALYEFFHSQYCKASEGSIKNY
jgi:hypothetical protein